MRRNDKLVAGMQAATNRFIIRITFLFLLVLTALGIPAAAQTWNTMPGAATDVGANAKGDVWVIGNHPVGGGYDILHWNNGSFQQVPGGAVRISVDPDGSAWIVNNTGNIFHWNGTPQWTLVPGSAMDIGVGEDGAVWIIGQDQSISRAIFSTDGTRTVTGWQKVDGGAVRIAIDPSGNPWVVNAGGGIYQRQGNTWTPVAGSAKDITVGPDGTVYIVNGTAPAPGGFSIMQRKGQTWASVGAAGVNIAAGAAGVVYVTQDGSTSNALIANLPATTPTSASTSASRSPFDFCWRTTKGRGAGQPLSTKSSDCGPGLEKDPNGLLCYPPCKAGYYGVGPVCYQSCPSGFNGSAAVCGKPASYGRGAGYVLWDQNKCNNENSQGCEQNGAMYYPKCKANFHTVGCCVCSPDCPSGWNDTGATCQGSSYGRTAGQVLGCAGGLERDGLLCYSSCGANSDGVGPVCWDHCPKSWVQCGMGCAESVAACATNTTNQIVSVLTAAANIAAEVLTAGAASGAVEAEKAALKAGKEGAGITESTSEIVERVSKLKFTKAFKQQGPLTKEFVTETLKQNVIPAKNLETMAKIPEKLGAAAQLVSNISLAATSTTMTEDQKNFQIAQDVLQAAATVDPTGLMDIVADYTKPVCSLVGSAEVAPQELDFDIQKAERAEIMLKLSGNE